MTKSWRCNKQLEGLSVTFFVINVSICFVSELCMRFWTAETESFSRFLVLMPPECDVVTQLQ